MMHQRLAALAALLALAACGGGGHGSSSAVPANVARSATASATLLIPAATTAAAQRREQYVSAATMWVTFSVNGGTAQGYDASTSSPNCTAVANGRSCSFTISLGVVVPGPQTVAVKTYTANPTPGPATLLSENTATVTLAAGAANVALPLVLDGVPAAATITVPAVVLNQGVNASVPLTITVTDPAGNAIIGNAPFDNNDTVQVTVPAGDSTLVATPLNGSATTATTVNVASPSTSVSLSYTGGPALDVIVYGALVRPSQSTLAIANGLVPVQPAVANVVDQVTSTPASANIRPVRGIDGSVYFATTSGVGKIAFTAYGAPTGNSCTQGGVLDVSASAANLGFAITTTTVESFPLMTFPSGNGTACGATLRATFAGPNTGQSLAATANGVYAASEGPFGTPGSGSPLYLSSFNSSTGANTVLENAELYSTSNATLYGDPAAGLFAQYSTANYGEDNAGATFTSATSGASGISVPTTDGDEANGIYTFGFDVHSSNLYLLDLSTYNDQSGTSTTPAVIDVTTNTQFPQTLPALNSTGAVVVALDGRVYVASGDQIYAYNPATASYSVTTVSAPTGEVNIGGCVVGADARLWCTDGSNGHIYAFPGGGATL